MFEKSWQGSPPASPPHVTIGARELIESAPDLIFCCDAEGAIQWLNSAVEPHLGYRPADMLGRPFISVVSESERDRVLKFFLRQRRDRTEITTSEMNLTSSSGGEVAFTARVKRVERPDGDVLFVGCARPLTVDTQSASPYAGPHAGATLSLSRHDEWSGGSAATGAGVLRPLAGDAGGTSDHAELSARLDEARSEAELKTDFLTTMSEELRSPINGILGMAQLLLETELDADQRSFIEVIQNSSRGLLNMVNDTLEFSQLEKDTLDIQAIDFDLRHTVEETAAIIAPLANEKGLAFDCRVHHEAPSLLRGDPARLRQVVCNLATTTMKLTAEGGVRILVEREHEDDERVMLRITTTCSGLSGTDADLGRVFSAWTALDDTEARRQGGAGLALAVGRKIVRNMDGEVGFANLGEQGVRFWFKVPLEKQGSARSAPAGGDEVQLRGLRVLVVDAAQVAREETLGMLAAWGCRAEGVSTHTDALARLRAEARNGTPFQLALIEMQLPDVDGAGLGRIIRDDASLGETRLMLLTAVGNRGDAERVREVGFAAYMVRPLSWAQLYDAVSDVVRQEQGTALVTRHSVAEARRGRVRILLVEDNQVNQIVAESVLQRLGYTVVKAANGARAIEALEQGGFDLILMDLQMPEVDGYRATAAMRARERGRQHTPIVAMTSTPTAEERRRCFDAGMDGYLSKPLDLGQMTSLVERFTLFGQGQATEEEGVPADADVPAAATAPGAGLELTDAQGTPQQRPALDTARLEESCMGIPALRDTLLKAFLEEVRPRMERMRQSVQVRDIRQVEFEAHGLKGMSATIGAAGCAEVFNRMESRSREGEVDGIVEWLSQAEQEVDRVIAFIQKYEEVLRRAA